MYRALARRDDSFEGIFWAGIKTTGVFCRPGCPAKTPKPKNVEYFFRTGDALAAGYRPCRRCCPMRRKGDFPEWLAPLMAEIDRDPMRRWTQQDLKDFGIDPARARRWFQKNHDMTFLSYLRSRRLGRAFSRIQEGSTLTEAAREADFDSVGGFYEALRKQTKSQSPGENAKAIYVSQTQSPMGPIIIAADEEAVCLVEFWDRRMLETQFSVLEKRISATFFQGKTGPARQMADELAEYFEGDRRVFETPVRYPGTEHQTAVWEGLRKVPYGETWSYAQLAKSIGKPRAVRSVARAVGENRLSIVIPCHRIVGAGGQLTGYGGGIWRKRLLLRVENEAAVEW